MGIDLAGKERPEAGDRQHEGGAGNGNGLTATTTTTTTTTTTNRKLTSSQR